MPTFWDITNRTDLCRRVERLTPESPAQWGLFNATQMLAHLNDAMRMAIGDLPVAARKSPLRYWPLRMLIIHVLPFPKSAPTAPELLARGDRAVFAAEQATFRTLADRAASKPPADRWPEHPAFGPLSHKDWGVLAYKHADHHLKQFGV